jgi:hypothetical protein
MLMTVEVGSMLRIWVSVTVIVLLASPVYSITVDEAMEFGLKNTPIFRPSGLRKR